MMNLYKSHMRSKMEYCCIVWSPLHIKDIRRLERIQKGFTKRRRRPRRKELSSEAKMPEPIQHEKKRDIYDNQYAAAN